MRFIKEYIKKHIKKFQSAFERSPVMIPVIISLFSIAILFFGIILCEIYVRGFNGIQVPFAVIVVCVLGAAFLVYPIVLTVSQIYFFFRAVHNDELYIKSRPDDSITIMLGIVYTLMYMAVFKEVNFNADWTVQLTNIELHTPVATDSVLTVVIVGIAGYIGYLIVNYIPLKKMPPLVFVTGIALMYLGTAVSVVWGIQVTTPLNISTLFLCLLPVNCVIITARTVMHKISEWKCIRDSECKGYNGADAINTVKLKKCNKILYNALSWPVAAFILMWPILGLLIVILYLFGQQPDSIITAWTQTSDWRLSDRIAPQNIYMDEHYLCTVAAGGHKRIVKPIRRGIRHGHEVVVNRQLCIANAFEQILEEKTPKIHRIIRNFYDKYGFPVAKLIRSKYVADFIYFLMKPLEWIFLAVIYFVDVRPENRIAVQYMGDMHKNK